MPISTTQQGSAESIKLPDFSSIGDMLMWRALNPEIYAQWKAEQEMRVQMLRENLRNTRVFVDQSFRDSVHNSVLNSNARAESISDPVLKQKVLDSNTLALDLADSHAMGSLPREERMHIVTNRCGQCSPMNGICQYHKDVFGLK